MRNKKTKPLQLSPETLGASLRALAAVAESQGSDRVIINLDIDSALALATWADRMAKS